MASDPLQQAALRVIRIGKNKDNDLVLEKPGISRYHAKLSLYTDFLGLLEDLDSSYGTQVNNQRIEKKLVTPTSKVVLGTVVPLDMQPLFDAVKPKPKPKLTPPPLPFYAMGSGAAPKSASYSQEFKRLEFHFDKYMQAKKDVQTDKTKTWIRIALMFVPGYGMQLAALADAYMFNPVEKMHVLDEAFKRDYICPNPDCQHFLGYAPYADLLFQKQCRYCRSKWVDD
jgi:hypothetical protein